MLDQLIALAKKTDAPVSVSISVINEKVVLGVIPNNGTAALSLQFDESQAEQCLPELQQYVFADHAPATSSNTKKAVASVNKSTADKKSKVTPKKANKGKTTEPAKAVTPKSSSAVSPSTDSPQPQPEESTEPQQMSMLDGLLKM